jgi:hypothetical protein
MTDVVVSIRSPPNSWGACARTLHEGTANGSGDVQSVDGDRVQIVAPTGGLRKPRRAVSLSVPLAETHRHIHFEGCTFNAVGGNQTTYHTVVGIVRAPVSLPDSLDETFFFFARLIQ